MLCLLLCLCFFLGPCTLPLPCGMPNAVVETKLTPLAPAYKAMHLSVHVGCQMLLAACHHCGQTACTDLPMGIPFRYRSFGISGSNRRMPCSFLPYLPTRDGGGENGPDGSLALFLSVRWKVLRTTYIHRVLCACIAHVLVCMSVGEFLGREDRF